LNDVTTLARGEDAEPKAGQLVIPNDVVLLVDFGGIDDPLGDLSHDVPPDRRQAPA
jgi:hypothetical protein